MHHSQAFKCEHCPLSPAQRRLFDAGNQASPHCRASPDGELIAVLTSPTVLVRSTRTLQGVYAVKLSPELSGPICTLLWSPSSTNILVATGDKIQVSSSCNASFQAIICNPTIPLSGKLPVISFGATETEVLVCSPSGLKLSVFDLSDSTAVEISNPKFFHQASAGRGFSFRPNAGHLVVLTRTAGKDVVSIHEPGTRKVTKSWCPDSVDAQGVQWTPDGRWILLWETPSQGRRLFIYSADGQQLRLLDTSTLAPETEVNTKANLELGIKCCHLSRDGRLCAVGDHSRGVTILQTGIWRSIMRLSHPHVITPLDTLQVWQEQSSKGADGRGIQAFLRATKPLSPVTVADGNMQAADPRHGCSVASFDASAVLLATRLDDCSSTVWIWDLDVGELRATLLFHSPVTFAWHPFVRECLLISCSDHGSQSRFYVWDPLSQGPVFLNTEQLLPASDSTCVLGMTWLNHEAEAPELLATDTQHFALLSLAEEAPAASPGTTARPGSERSVAWSAQDSAGTARPAEPIVITEDAAKLDDTFSFRHT